jgi:MFS family permease
MINKLKGNVLFSLPFTIWGVGLVVLLINFSTIIIYSLLPFYLIDVFHISCSGLGQLEGVVEFLALTTRIFAGILSDIMHRRKPLLLAAVALIAIARPIFPLAPNMIWILVSRLFDRIGNGLQATPREALIGDYAPPGKKGTCYGLRESLGKVGSFLGAGLTLIWLSMHFSSYENVFWVASITPLLAVLLVILFIKDLPSLIRTPTHKRTTIFAWENVTRLSQNYWFTIILSFLFMLTNYSGAFLILQGKQVTGSETIAPLAMIVQNFAAMLVAYPMGRLFDRYNHRLILGAGFIVVIISNMCLAFAMNAWFILLGAFFWGIQFAWTQSLFVAKVASYSNKDNRGTAFAIYYLFVGLGYLICNTVFGKLTDLYSLQYGFFFSSAVAAIAFFFLPLIKKS